MKAFAGTTALFRLYARLDRVRLPIWIGAVSLLVCSTASAFTRLYPTLESRREFASTLAGTPVLLALTGPPFNLDTIGGLTAWRVGGLGGVLMGTLGLLTVNRHTRAEEEAGRLELVGSTAVGRMAPTAAALLLAFGACATVGGFIAAGLVALGMPAGGSMALGLAFAAAGCTLASLGAVTAQLAESARTSAGVAGGTLGLLFGLRAVGDSSGPTWLSWISPLGWSQQVRPFAVERWWVFGLLGAVCALLTGLAFVLNARRDLGAGLVPARPGPASGTLSTPTALAWRTQRANVAGWTAGAVVMGGAFGSIAPAMGNLVTDNAQLRDILTALGGSQQLIRAFFGAAMGVVAILATALSIQTIHGLRSEELALRAEPTLATRVTRARWVAGHCLVALLGACLLMACAALAAGLAYTLQTGESSAIAELLGASLVQLPAIAVLSGVALAVLGLVPRFAAASWAFFGLAVVLDQLGPILGVNQFWLGLSPYSHVPQLPGDAFAPSPLASLTVVAATLFAAGFCGWNRRDIG